MKILIVSDTHRRDANLETVLDIEKNMDLLIHLGDVEGSEDYIEAIAYCDCLFVAGNNDYFCSLPKELRVDIGPFKAMLTHGHHYNVSLGIERIVEEGLAQGRDIVMFGHTHRPLVEELPGITVLNPGSLSYPRQSGRQATYIIMEVNTEGEVEFTLKHV